MLLVRNSLRQPENVRAPSTGAVAYFEKQEGYRPSPLVSLTSLADQLGCQQVLAKIESDRFGLRSFKILGAGWALQVLRSRGVSVECLLTATDGNHGKAVARLARREGIRSIIFVPGHCSDEVKESLQSDGASVVQIAGTYDDAVDAAERHVRGCAPDVILLSDTSADSEDVIANSIIDGYGTIFSEWKDQRASLSLDDPDLVIVQIGIGGLAAAASQHFHHLTVPPPKLIGIEPISAAAALRSAEAGTLVRVDASAYTSMVGLNAGLISAAAWNDLKYGFDEFIAIGDEYCEPALRALYADGVVTKATGASPVCGLLALAKKDKTQLLGRRVLIVISEGGEPLRTSNRSRSD